MTKLDYRMYGFPFFNNHVWVQMMTTSLPLKSLNCEFLLQSISLSELEKRDVHSSFIASLIYHTVLRFVNVCNWYLHG